MTMKCVRTTHSRWPTHRCGDVSFSLTENVGIIFALDDSFNLYMSHDGALCTNRVHHIRPTIVHGCSRVNAGFRISYKLLAMHELRSTRFLSIFTFIII